MTIKSLRKKKVLMKEPIQKHSNQGPSLLGYNTCMPSHRMSLNVEVSKRTRHYVHPDVLQMQWTTVPFTDCAKPKQQYIWVIFMFHTWPVTTKHLIQGTVLNCVYYDIWKYELWQVSSNSSQHEPLVKISPRLVSVNYWEAVKEEYEEAYEGNEKYRRQSSYLS